MVRATLTVTAPSAIRSLTGLGISETARIGRSAGRPWLGCPSTASRIWERRLSDGGRPAVGEARHDSGEGAGRWRYIAAPCRLGTHAACDLRAVAPCTCPCHADIYSVVWREGDYVVVTYASGEVELRSGRLLWAEELARSTGLRGMTGTVLGREEWVREPEVFIRSQRVGQGRVGSEPEPGVVA